MFLIFVINNELGTLPSNTSWKNQTTRLFTRQPQAHIRLNTMKWISICLGMRALGYGSHQTKRREAFLLNFLLFLSLFKQIVSLHVPHETVAIHPVMAGLLVCNDKAQCLQTKRNQIERWANPISTQFGFDNIYWKLTGLPYHLSILACNKLDWKIEKILIRHKQSWAKDHPADPGVPSQPCPC